MKNPPGVALAAIDQANWRAAMSVQVTPDQLRFVAGYQPIALLILAKAYVQPGDLGWEPLAVTSEGSVVAVAALAHASTHSELLHFAVDASRQRAGIGSAAVELLVAHVVSTRPNAREVRLTVHPDNAGAQQFYRGRGFLPTGAIRDGEPVWSRSIRRQV
jgi:diamine N-acetyltransferase